MTAPAAETSVMDWMSANQAYLNAELQRLRLRIRRRVLWLRRRWSQDPLQTYPGLVISENQADWLLAGGEAKDESRFYREDPTAVEIGNFIREAERELGERVKAMADAGSPPPLYVLANLFGLTPFERNVLLLCLAPDLDPTFERLYAYVQDDVNRKYATPHLALELCVRSADGDGEEYKAAWSAFLPESPLFHFRLVALDSGPGPITTHSTRPLRLDERIAAYCRGVNRPDERVVPLLRRMPPSMLPPAHRELVDRLAHTFESNLAAQPWPVLNLTGPSGIGKQGVAGAVCESIGLHLSGLDFNRLPAPGAERQEMLRLLEREAALMQFGVYLDAMEADPSDKAATVLLDEVIEHLEIFLVVGSLERWHSRRETLAVRVPKPDAGAKHALWQAALAGVRHTLDGQIDAVVEQFDFGPQAILQAVAAAQALARMRAPEDGAGIDAEDLWQACRDQAGRRLDELVQRITPCYAWEDIVLPDDVSRLLREIAAQVALRHKVYEEWEFGAKLSRGRGISALFSGPSGTGKTMAAEILARHLRLDLYRIDLAGVVSKYIGETEKNLKKVFDAAEQSGAILFFDEADSVFGKRTEVKDSHDRYANIEVNYLLQRMEDYRGLAILATNRKSALDGAFLRRLRFLVDFPFPDAADRKRIWRKAFPSKAAVSGLDYDALAKMDITGGNIRNIALNAAFLAADEGAPIGMGHVMHAARREYAKTEKLVTEAEFGSR
ncbi:MAG: ATP-binding protein [Anaerolineales bacterium]